MTVVNPFKALRPASDMTERIAALPYDVYNRQEAKAVVQANPYSFLQIDRGETLLDDTISTYDPLVYETAAKRLHEMIREDQLVYDDQDYYYIYELKRLGKVQRGIVGLVQAKEYESGIIKKHENTREVKEKDRIMHINTLKAHTGPIYLTYKNNFQIQQLFDMILEKASIIFDFIGDDQVRHKGYKVQIGKHTEVARQLTSMIDVLYIADGHHRAASAVKIAEKYNYQGEYAQFLAVLFPDNELSILDYNRVVTDLNGHSLKSLMEHIEINFDIKKTGKKQVQPSRKATFGMFVEGEWYELCFKQENHAAVNPVNGLDVSILQDYLLKPILGIDNPKVSERIDFVGGIRGLNELESRVGEDMKIAFSMFPTSIDELMLVSDAGLLMPPKSTWFEPKLKSGLFIHMI